MTTVEFLAHHKSFAAILGERPQATVLAESESGAALFHEACVYHQPSKSVFVTSNQIPTSRTYDSGNGKEVKLFRIYDSEEHGSSSGSAGVVDVTPAHLANSMLNGGVNYGRDGLLMCAQGSLGSQDLSGLVVLKLDDKAAAASPFSEVVPMVTTFFGDPFNSVNDVVVHPKDGSIWFTDPCYGHYQGFRPPPQLPNQVYRFDATTKAVRAVADGFVRPNGICFSPDLRTVYVTDTGAILGAPPIDPAGPSHIYAFDLVRPEGGGASLVNRRLFAYAPGRVPDGIKCDTNGNVYAGCGDGVEVWNPAGDLLGTIHVPGGVANFCFGEKGTMYICNETKFLKVNLNSSDVRGALLGI